MRSREMFRAFQKLVQPLSEAQLEHLSDLLNQYIRKRYDERMCAQAKANRERTTAAMIASGIVFPEPVER